MHHRRLASVTFVALLCGLTAHAQPSLSSTDVAGLQGTWILDVARSGIPEAERRVITVGPTWVRVEIYRDSDDHPPTLIYNLDGSATVNPFGTASATGKLRREGDALLTETIYDIKERPITVRELLRTTPDGSELSVEVSVRVEHGYQGVRPPLEKTPPNLSTAVMMFQKER
jgi:hypothetical protein